MSRVSQINLYDEQTLSIKSTIKASGSDLILPDNTVCNGMKLSDKGEAIFNLNDVLQALTQKLIPTSEESYVYNGSEALAIKADQGAPTANPTDPGLGWYFSNTSVSSPDNKINWYFVGGDVKRVLGENYCTSAKLKVYNNGGLSTLPFLSIYTKPQGAGDAASWYRSRQTFIVDNADVAKITPGSSCLLVHGTDPVDFHPSIPHYTLVKDAGTSVGPQGQEEEIFLISLSTDSGATQNSVKFALTEFTSSYGGNTQVIKTTS